MTVTEQAEVIKNHLIHDLDHPYVGRFLPKPVIDMDKIVVYCCLYRNRALQRDVDIYVESTMAAEIGLATHETMTTGRLTDRQEMKRRQLTALSGDFYSALYYYALARRDDIEVVRWIAEAIERFNISKCRLFYPEHTMTWGQAIRALSDIESGMMARIADKLGFGRLVGLLNDYFLSRKLILERNQWSGSGTKSFLLTHLREHLTSDAQTVGARLEKEIEKSTGRFFRTVRKAKESEEGPSFQLMAYLTDRMRAFSGCMVGES